MSTEQLDRYKKLYSDYIAHAVNLHNYHQVFIENIGLGSSQGVRSSLREMIKIERELQHACRSALEEYRENIKQERAAWKARRAKQKERVMPIYKGKKKNDNRS